MVTDNHYRWDFIGLSTDQKPTPATSEKVVDGSTFYCSDTSKLYVFCKDTWYERKPLGSGGSSYTAGTGIDITEDTISIDDDVVATLEELNARIAKGEGAPTTATEGVVGGLYEDNTNGKLYQCTAIDTTNPNNPSYTWTEIGAGGGSGITTLTTTDYNYPAGNPTRVALWMLTPGIYRVDGNTNVAFNTSTSVTPPEGTEITIEPKGDYVLIVFYDPYLKIFHTSKSLGSSKAIYQVTDSLTDASISASNSPLSARQGNVLKTLIDGLITSNAAAPTTSTAGVLGQLYTDTTNMHTYQLTAISGDTYTWTQRW